MTEQPRVPASDPLTGGGPRAQGRVGDYELLELLGEGGMGQEPMRRLHPELAFSLNDTACGRAPLEKLTPYRFRMQGDMDRLFFLWNPTGRMDEPWNLLENQALFGVQVTRTSTDGVVTATDATFESSTDSQVGFFVYVAEDTDGQLSNLVFLEIVPESN